MLYGSVIVLCSLRLKGFSEAPPAIGKARAAMLGKSLCLRSNSLRKDSS